MSSTDGPVRREGAENANQAELTSGWAGAAINSVTWFAGYDPTSRLDIRPVFQRSPMRKSVSAAAVCFTLFCGLPSMSHAQFWARILNPRVTVDMRHPPAFGLDLETVVFGPVSGECADEIIQSLIASLLADEINVVNRQEADLILGEHQLSESGWVLPESAAAVGELLGPSVLIAVNVDRCATQQQPSYRDHVRKRKDPDTAEEYEVLEREFFSRTSAFVNVSVQVVDMATGRIVGVIRSNHSPELVNSSREGQPEFPGAYAVLDMAYSQVYEDVSRRLLGWTERRELVFYDDDECGLKQAHRALESARFDRALELSLANLDACQATAGVKTNKLARAYYNVGMSHAVVGQNQAALGYLRRAAELDDGGIVRDAIASAETAVRLQEELRQYEESTAAEAAQRSAELETRAEATEANTLSNGDVVVLVELGLSEAIVVKKIQTSACRFDTSADGLVALTNAGVPEPIILAMMDARCGGA